MSHTTQKAQGITFQQGDGASPEVFTTIAGLVGGVPALGHEGVRVDTTDQVDTVEQDKEVIAVGQEIELEIDYNGTTQQDNMETDNQSDVTRAYKVTFTDSPATVFTFSAKCIMWKLEGPLKGKLTLRATLKFTTIVTVA